MTRKFEAIASICNSLAADDMSGAAAAARSEYPFTAIEPAGRNYTALASTQVFVRDGFSDRYSGQRLVFPGVLRLLSRLLPDELPFHLNWKQSECHFMYWELFPTIDHVVPVARGGADAAENWVCTSMLRNSAKSNWTLEELGWTLHPVGSMDEWDGQLAWYVKYLARHPEHLQDAYLRRWHNAAVKAV